MSNLTRRDALKSVAAASLAPVLSTAGVRPPRGPSAPDLKESQRTILAYLHDTAPQLLRKPGGVLRFPSIAPSLPGKEYSSSLWDWDTLWTARGLFAYAAQASDADFQATLLDHCKGSLLNFFDHQAPSGRIPILITTAQADPLGSLAPDASNARNQAKPIFAQLALLLADQAKDATWFTPHFDSLISFYRSWSIHNLSPSGLYVWGNDVAIGNDNDPTTFGRPDFSSANLLLNCLFFADLTAAAQLANRLAQHDHARDFATQAKVLGDAILRHCWDPRDRFFYTADVQCVDRRAELIPNIPLGMPMSWQTLPLRLQTFTGLLPLWCGLATPAQAHQLVASNLADDRLLANYGIRTLSNRESMYSLAASSNPSNWLGPVWIIANYFAWKALSRYGFTDQANHIAAQTISLLAADIRNSGSMNEYYHPDTGQPLSHQGFMDWNLLVLEMFSA